MFELIDIYQKVGNRWVYTHATRMHKTLVAAKKHYLDQFGSDVKCKFAHREYK